MKIIGCDFHPSFSCRFATPAKHENTLEPRMRREYQRLAQRRCRALAKVAMARKLAVRLYWMLREEKDYAQLIQGSHAEQSESFRGRS